MGIKARLCQFYFPRAVASSAVRRLSASSGVVLMYHEVLPDEVTIPSWTIVKETDFKWQMCLLQAHFDVLTIEQALARVAGKTEGLRPFAVVTFDDGYKGTLNTALPILESMGLPFIVYVATQAVIEKKLFWHDQIIQLLNIPADVKVSFKHEGRSHVFKIPHRASDVRRWEAVQRILVMLKQMKPEERRKKVDAILKSYPATHSDLAMLSPDDLKRLAASSCVTIGSHTHGHELLDQLDSREIIDTLQTASEHIAYMIGKTPIHFAYPNGNFNQRVLDHVREEGFVTAMTTEPGMWSDRNDFLEIPRVGVGRFQSEGGFMARVSGYL